MLRDKGKAYWAVLSKFNSHLVSRGIVLSTTQSVDRAAFDYLRGARRSHAEITLSALYKAYPALRGALGNTASMVHDMIYTQPTQHHAAMPWGVALVLAETLRLLGFPRRAVALLLQWRTGVRPGELVQIHGDDITYCPGGVSVIRLGMRRGTKTRRRAAIRILPDDWRTAVVLRAVLALVAAGEPLCDWVRTVDITRSLQLAGRVHGWPDLFTAHCPRAGWASAHWIAGTPIAELQEMGRWSSIASLRIYLDYVGSSQLMAADPFCSWALTMAELDSHFAHRW